MNFIDLKLQQKEIRSKIDNRIKNVLDSNSYILGEEVKDLENQLSIFCGAKHSICCSNGTDAIMLALMALDIGPGDGVITVPFTYIATIEAIAAVGATPILVDVYDSTFNIDVTKIEEAVNKSNKQVKAIMPVDLFGLPARHRLINEIAKKYGLYVIDDAAQSFGASKYDKKIGTFSDITTTSFFPAKPLGCYGDGGAIFTDSDKLNNKLRSLAVHGQGEDKYDNVRIGMNSRLDTIQAAILLEKLNIFPEEIEQRNFIASLYREKFEKLNIACQYIPKGYKSVYAQFSIILNSERQRNIIQESLKKENIPSVVYYLIPGHLQKGYQYLGYKKGDFLVSENLSKRILSLPMHPYLNQDSIKKITNIIENNLN